MYAFAFRACGPAIVVVASAFGADSWNETDARTPAGSAHLKDIVDKSGRQVMHLACAPSVGLIASVPGYWNFRRGQKPLFPIHVWDLSSGKLIKTLAAHNKDIRYLKFTADGKKLLSGAPNEMILWDPIQGNADNQTFKSNSSWAVLTPSENRLFWYDDMLDVVIWDVRKGKRERELVATKDQKRRFGSAPEAEILLSDDERLLAVGAGPGNQAIIVWDYRSGKILKVLEYESQLTRLSFSQTGQYLFASGTKKEPYLGRAVMNIWDTKSWNLIHEIETDRNELHPILHVPDDDFIISVDSIRKRRPREDDGFAYKTMIGVYSIKLGKRLFDYETNLTDDTWCSAAIHIRKMNAVCLGTSNGIITFVSVPEILNRRDKR